MVKVPDNIPDLQLQPILVFQIISHMVTRMEIWEIIYRIPIPEIPDTLTETRGMERGIPNLSIAMENHANVVKGSYDTKDIVSHNNGARILDLLIQLLSHNLPSQGPLLSPGNKYRLNLKTFIL